MTFVEYCEDVFGHELPEWQKNYLEKAYEMAKEKKTLFVFPPRRGNGKSTSELITIFLLYDYFNSQHKHSS